MLDNPIEPDDRKKARELRAQAYFDQDLKKQRDWYGSRASKYKSRGQLLSLLVIVAGIVTTFVQIFSREQHWWIPAITAGLGGVVTLTEGWQRIARYSEVWISYRTASERMKREFRLYVNGAGAYRSLEEDGAYLEFVENIEAIIAEEQQIYWQAQHGAAGSGTPERERSKS